MTTVKTMTRTELKEMNRRDFNSGDIVRVGKYLIFFKDADWGIGGNHDTRAEHDDRPMIPVKESKMPHYIHDLVF